jgi:hypothetical protein
MNPGERAFFEMARLLPILADRLQRIALEMSKRRKGRPPR